MGKPTKPKDELLCALERIAEAIAGLAEGFGRTVGVCECCGCATVVTRQSRRLCWRCHREIEDEEAK
jgi:hypothetical protein